MLSQYVHLESRPSHERAATEVALQVGDVLPRHSWTPRCHGADGGGEEGGLLRGE